MNRRAVWAFVRLGFGAIAVIAIVDEVLDAIREGATDPLDFFSFYSPSSAILGTVVLLVAAAHWRQPNSRLGDLLRGEAVVCLAMTGLMHGVHLVDDRAEILPLVLVVDWLVDPPSTHLSFRTGFVWLAFPAIWTVYTLGRGLLVGWYPYPFLDPRTAGYGSATIYLAALGVGFTLLCVAVVALGNIAREWHGPGAGLLGRWGYVADLVEERQ